MKVNYYDDDDYSSDVGFKKFNEKGKSKPHHKGHYSKRGAKASKWDSYDQEENSYIEATTLVIPTPASPTPVVRKTFTPGVYTHTIKGNQIDFEGVINIEKVSSEHNGTLTYGIKFLFAGSKGLSRVIWYNTRLAERDRVFQEEYKYWQSVPHK